MKKISKGRRKKIINKKRIITHKSRKKNLKSNKTKKDTCICQKRILKIMFFLFFIFLSKYCNYYSQKLLNYYYTKRVQMIKSWGRTYDESNLVTIEDKINWIAIHDVKKLKGKCADKILLHQFSKRILKKDICNKILKIYDDPYKIDISELPEQFVLKTNHGSGFNIIVYNKNELDVNWAKKQLHDWLQIDYGKIGLEYHYSLIKRKVFAEEYIGKHLNNYKFLCFNGEPKFVFIYKKVDGIEYRTFFDINWNRLDFNCVTSPHPTDVYPKPQNYELMIKYARKLSKPFKLVRVDLYENNGDIRLGELTFTPFNSHLLCKKQEHNIELGKYLKLF